jgi:hypothetical protein
MGGLLRAVMSLVHFHLFRWALQIGGTVIVFLVVIILIALWV